MNRIGSQQICEGGGIELYVGIETYIAFSCTLLRELGRSAVHSFGRSSSSRRGAGICGANFDTRVARDAAGEHRNSTREHRRSARWDGNTASWNHDTAKHSGGYARPNSECDGARIEFAGDPDPGKHDAALHHQPQYSDESG